MSDIADRVKKIVVEHLGVEEDKVVDKASFIDDLDRDPRRRRRHHPDGRRRGEIHHRSLLILVS
jgi:hypothetical protein